MRRRKKRAVEEAAPLWSIGRILAILRAALDITQSALARGSGVKRASISEYESGITIPDASTLGRLLTTMRFRWAALDLTCWYLKRLFTECRLSEGEIAHASEPSSREILAGELTDLAARLTEMAEALRGGPPTVLSEAEASGAPESGSAPRDREAARAFWSQVRTLPADKHKEALQQMPASIAWAVCELLCLESQALCGTHPDRADRLVDLAFIAADRISRDDPARTQAHGIAWAHRGNVLRVRDQFQAAETAFASAERSWEAGAGMKDSRFEKGLIGALKASLRRAQRRFDEAGELLEHSAAVTESTRLRVQIIVSRAKLCEEQGELEEAVAILQGVHGAAIPDDDGRIALCVEHNLADALSKLDRFDEAQALLPAVRELSRNLGGELDQVRLRWTEGRVAAGLGRVEDGLRAFVAVRGAFAARHMAYDTALVSLELAALYAQEGRTEEVKALARHMVPIFRSKEVHREALAALTLFRQAAERERVTAEFAREVVVYLRKARYNPELRFEGRVAA